MFSADTSTSPVLRSMLATRVTSIAGRPGHLNVTSLELTNIIRMPKTHSWKMRGTCVQTTCCFPDRLSLSRLHMYWRISARRHSDMAGGGERRKALTTCEHVHMLGRQGGKPLTWRLAKYKKRSIALTGFQTTFILITSSLYIRLQKWSTRLLVRRACYVHTSRPLITVSDISLAAFGRKEIEIAEVSMNRMFTSKNGSTHGGDYRMRCPVSCSLGRR